MSVYNAEGKLGKAGYIKGQEPGQAYQYLAVDKRSGIQQSTVREQLRREYFRRVKIVIWTGLYGWNTVIATNALALPVLT